MLKRERWMPPLERHPAAPAAPPADSMPGRPVVLTPPPSTAAAAGARDEQNHPTTADAPGKESDPPGWEANDAEHPDPAHASDSYPENLPATDHSVVWRHLGTLCLVLMGSFLLIVLIQDLVLFLKNELHARPLVGGILSFLALGGLGTAMIWTAREWYRLSRLRELRQLAAEAKRLAANREFSGDAWAMTQRIAPLYQHNPGAMAGLERFYDSVDDTLEDPHILQLFSHQVLGPVDARAMQVVVHHVSNTTLLTALSPLPLVDALVFLWHNIRMVRAVAQCYGVHPGTVGSWILLRDGCQGLLVAGTTDILANHVGNILGNSLATMFLARAGQGMANGLFTARIGLQAIRLCRPLPFTADELPGMTRLRKTMAAALAQAFQGGGENKTPGKEVQPR
ncbi:MAG: TIGR01620 family protein [Magnetococcales bacterium]|nr:TIGR01620 family protein [Magnetococcales bacterium]